MTLFTPFVENGIELFLRLLLLVTEGGSFFEILRLDRSFLFHPDLFYFLFDALHVWRPRHGVNTSTRAGLIHYIDRLVGEKSSRDIAIGKSDGSLQRLIRKFCFVVGLVLGSETFQDLNGFVNGRRIHLYRLETAFQRCVFLDVLAVFVHRGRADTLQFATTQRGLDDVRCVHRAFGRSCSDDGVQFVNEKNDGLGTADFVHYGFDALFELAAVFCSGDHQRQIECDHASVAQQFGHVAVCNLLSQSFGNGRLADACFADQDWIVLGPPAKHLNYALDFITPANYGIEFSLPRQFSQVTAECAKRWSFDVLLRRFATFLLRFRRREVWIELFKNLVASAFDIEFEALEHSGGNPLALAQKSKQNMFRADVRMIERLGFLAC